MYIVHKTEGVVLGVATIGEANIRATILTRELGLIRVHAQSGRKSPKFRPHLVRFSRIMIDVVHGKRGWILAPRRSGESIQPLLRLARMTATVVGPNEPNLEIYEFWESMLDQVIDHDDWFRDPVIAKGLELAGTMHLLAMEGYWDGDTVALDLEGYETASVMAKRLIPIINETLKRTHLITW